MSHETLDMSLPHLPEGNWHHEAERKFLVHNPPEDYRNYPHAEILQGYDADGVRYRRADFDDGRIEYTTGFKVGTGVLRRELEDPISERDFQIGMSLTKGKKRDRVIPKTRYYIDLGDGVVIHLDFYHGDLEGHITAEPEFEAPTPEEKKRKAEEWEPLDWMRDKKGVPMEVTHDRRYSNKTIASKGWPKNGKWERRKK